MPDLLPAAASPLTLSAVWAERLRQHALHPMNCLDRRDVDPRDKLAALVEEVGEVAHALTYDADPDNVERELVQVAACALAWLDSYDVPAAE